MEGWNQDFKKNACWVADVPYFVQKKDGVDKIGAS
jgi:hypothetical protein